MKQKTISKQITLPGVNIFNGNPAKITFSPAESNTGYILKLNNDEFSITLDKTFHAKKCYRTRWASTMEVCNEDLSVLKPEHIIPTLYFGLEIDNLHIELSDSVFPRFDNGVSQIISRLENMVTTNTQERKYFSPSESQQFGNGIKDTIRVVPHEFLKIMYHVDFPHKAIGKQKLRININPKKFKEELMYARGPLFPLFGSEKLTRILFGITRNKHKQATYENSLIIGPKKQKSFNNKTCFYFPENTEFVRHKIIDALAPPALYCLQHKARISCAELIYIKTGHKTDLTAWKKFTFNYLG